MAGRLFNYIQDYSYLHFNAKLPVALNQAVKLGVVGIEDYFVSRCI